MCKRVATIAWRRFLGSEFKERTENLDFPSWVELRRLGDSHVVKLTALAPVMGSLILMNDEVTTFLRSSFLDLNFDHSKQLMLGFVPIPRLHMIYLGLSLLGVGAICFGLLCPDVIKRYPSAEAWLEGEDRFLTGGRLRAEFYDLVQTYWDNTKSPRAEVDEKNDEEDLPWYWQQLESRDRRGGYSHNRYWQIHVLIDEIVETDDPSEHVWEPPAEKPGRILTPDGQPAVREVEEPYDTESERTESFQRFRAGPRGHVNTDSWLYVLANRLAYERGLWETLAYMAADKFKERVIYIRFQDFSYQNRIARGFITTIYGLGIVALSIPTLHTFGAIIANAFRQMHSVAN